MVYRSASIGFRVLCVLTFFAVLSMVGSTALARGRGGRAAGAARSAGGRAAPGQAARPALATQGARPQAALSGGSQLSGMLNQQTSQVRNNLANRSGQLQQNAQNWANQFQNRPQPFTPAWYAQHPNAWQYTHPHADAVAVASTAAVATWIGAAYAPVSSGGSSTTVIYESAPAETVAAEPMDPPEAAADETLNSEEWLPLGVFAVSTDEKSPALVMLQLVVDHQGTLRGVYYDSITDTTHNIVGTVDRNTQLAQWQIESSSQVAFQTPLSELTQDAGALELLVPAGPQKWHLTRVAEAP